MSQIKPEKLNPDEHVSDFERLGKMRQFFFSF